MRAQTAADMTRSDLRQPRPDEWRDAALTKRRQDTCPNEGNRPEACNKGEHEKDRQQPSPEQRLERMHGRSCFANDSHGEGHVSWPAAIARALEGRSAKISLQ